MGYSSQWDFDQMDREFVRRDDMRRERLRIEAAAKADEAAEDDKRELPEPLNPEEDE